MEQENGDPSPQTARMMPSILEIVLICGAVLSIITYIRAIYRLRHFKGPLLAVTSKLWMLKCCYYKSTHWELKKLCDKYGKVINSWLEGTFTSFSSSTSYSHLSDSIVGSVVRISPDTLVTDDVDLLLRMSAVRSPYSKGDFYQGTQFDMEVNHIFSEINEARHLDLRSKLSSGVRVHCYSHACDANLF